jgi:hypothetical protein
MGLTPHPYPTGNQRQLLHVESRVGDSSQQKRGPQPQSQREMEIAHTPTAERVHKTPSPSQPPRLGSPSEQAA